MTDRCLYLLYSGLLLLALQACSDKSLTENDGISAEGKEIRFQASIGHSSLNGSTPAMSRAGETVEGEYVEMTSQAWGDWDIHIHHKNLTTPSDDAPEVQRYKVASGTQGILDIEQEKKWWWRVNANGSDSHLFQAWTEPNGEATEVVSTDATGAKTVDFEAGNKIIWDENGDGKTYIGHYLNFLIGTAAGPVDYKTNGLYVPLYFKRLVSRIRITSILHYYGDGSYSKTDISVTDIEFPDMYRTGTLLTHAGEQEEGTGAALFPEVVTSNRPEQEKGLFVAFEDIYKVYAAAGGVPVYVPPFDFTEAGRFIIGHLGSNVQNGEITYNTYYGDLAKVFLNRDEHQQELLAGESMDIMLELKDDEITGIYVYIQPWNTEADKEILQHPRPGIYSDGELLALRNAITNGNEIPESMYETDEQDQKVIRIYNDISLAFSGESTINIPDGYVLDGMGHNISCNGSLTISGTTRDLRINGSKVGG